MDLPPQFLTICSQLGALGVALLSMWWMRQDKAIALKAFAELNEERKQMALAILAALTANTAAITTWSGKCEELERTVHELEKYIRDRS